MVLINNLKKQVDIPVWEWCRFAPQVSVATSATTAADNSIYHVSHGRYIYYLEDASTVIGGTLVGKGFWRYDTVTDSYQQLAFPPIAPATFSALQFVGGHGYYGRVLSATSNTITCAALTGQTLSTFDIRIIGGTGIGQHRVITAVSDPVIADSGTVISIAGLPGNVSDTNKNWVVNQWVGYQLRFVSATGNSGIRKILYNSSTALYFADVNKYAEDLNAYAPEVLPTGGAIALPAVGTQYQIESSTMTVDSNWTVQPDATSRFLVHSGGIWLLSSGTTYTMQYYDVAADLWYVRNSCAGAATGGPVFAAGTDATIINTGEVALIEDRGIATAGSTTTTLEDTTKSWAVNSLSAANYKVRIFSGTCAGQVRSIVSNTATTITVLASTPWSQAPDVTSRYLIDGLDGGGGATVSAANVSQTAVATGSTIFGNIFNAVTVTSGAFYAGQILTTSGIPALGVGTMNTATVTSKMGACFTSATSASTIILSQGDTTGITAGMLVTKIAGSGTIPAGTTVVSVNTTLNTILMSASTTAACVGDTLQFSTQYVSAVGATSVGNTITVGSTAGLVRGMIVTVPVGAGVITAGTYVVDIMANGTQFTISTTPTTALTGGANIVAGTPYQTVITNQISGIPGGAGTYYVWPAQTVTATTITGTGIATLTDTSKTWPLHRWNGQSVRIIAGTGAGQVRSIVGTKDNNTVVYTSAASASSSGNVITVTDVTGLVAGMQVTVTAGTGVFAWGTTVTSINVGANTFTVSALPTTILSGATVKGSNNNTLLVTPAWTTLPDTTSSYVIHGDSDKLYFSLAGQTPTFVHNVESDTVTQGRMLEYGVARGVSAQYSDHPAVAISSGIPVQPITYMFGSSASATAYFGMGPFLTTSLTGSGGYVTILFTAYPGSTYTGTTTIPVGSLITTTGITAAGYTNGDFVVTSSGPGSVTFSSAGNGQTVAGILSSGQKFNPTGSGIVQIAGCVPTAYNTPSVTATASGAGFVTWTNTTVGQLTTTGFIQHIAQAQTGYATIGGPGGTTATITCAGTWFPIGSWVSVAGVVTFANATWGNYNGVYQVTASSAGSCSYIIPSNTPTGTATAYGTIQAATTTQWMTTVNPHNFRAGFSVTHRGDSHYAGSCTNITALVYPVTVPGTLNQYIYSTGTGVYTSAAGATSSGTTISVTNVSGLTVGMQVTVTTGTGVFASNTSVVSINTGANTFVVSATPLTTLSGGANVVTGSPYAGTQIVYTQTTSMIVDAAKNWIPNQYANCIVNFNTNQSSGTGGTNPNVLSAYIVANTPTQLIFAAAHTLPVSGLTRYVITMPPASQNNSVLGAADAGLAIGVQSTILLTDITKYWVMPANVTGRVCAGATIGASSIVLLSVDGIFPGMVVVATTSPATTCIASTLTTTIKVDYIDVSLLKVYLVGGTLTGTTFSTTFSFLATATSSGTTVTLSGFTTQYLSVGMYLGVSSVDNIKVSTNAVALPVMGALVQNGGAVLTNVYVTAVTSATTFTISSVPTTPLLNAALFASAWFAGQWIGRRLRLTTGVSTNYIEPGTAFLITGSSTVGTLGFPALASTAVTGVTGYAILQQPVRGQGTDLNWNFGQSDYARRGVYLYQARGGGVTGFDRLNLQNDYWDFLTPTPNYEVLGLATMYAYDGADRLYFTPANGTATISQRVYYLDMDKMQIHGASYYPYVAIATAPMVGNRMEIFSTVDGLKYLWLNRHGGQECFKQLLFY